MIEKQPIAEKKTYYFQCYLKGLNWVEKHEGENAFEALLTAKDLHKNKENFWIELVDWNILQMH